MSAEDVLSRPLSPARKAALAWEIVVLYAGVRRRLRRRTPLPDLLASLRAAGAGDASPERHPALAHRLAWAVERVLRLLPGDSRCLVRSLVLVGLLARRSIPASLVIAVRGRGDFIAHAWVEREGRALLPPGGEEFTRLGEL